MAEIEVPGPEPDWQPATQPSYGTGRNPAHQFSVWEHSVHLFQMIGVLALPVQPVAERLRLIVERSWDGLDSLDAVLFELRGFGFAISKHDGNPVGVSYVWLTMPHEQADQALDTLLEVVGIGEDAIVFRGNPHEGPGEGLGGGCGGNLGGSSGEGPGKGSGEDLGERIGPARIGPARDGPARDGPARDGGALGCGSPDGGSSDGGSPDSGSSDGGSPGDGTGGTSSASPRTWFRRALRTARASGFPFRK
ncbi:hypothetical protein ACPEIF_14945 [Streptomyces sp. NPDC012600]|uniref:hypothetical protein n=1 Tax=Streptomyces sp. NPDC012600 TaxID=3415005 RepID=UPI003C2BA198